MYTIYLTTECNFQCSYCYEEYTKNISINKEKLKVIIDFILDCEEKKDTDTLAINFMGGEPLLKKDLIFQAINYIKDRCKKKVLYYMTTNGSLLDEKMIIWMKQHNFFLRISVDGNEETHRKNRLQKNGRNDYKKIMENLKCVKRNGLMYSIRMTVAKNTLDQIYNNVTYFYELGFDKISIVLDIDMQFGKIEQEVFRNQMEMIADYYLSKIECNPSFSIDMISGKLFGLLTESERCFTMCGAGISSFCIMPDGNIYPCAYVTNNELFKIGTIEKGINISQAYNIPKQLFKKDFRECMSCEAKNMCHSMKCGYLNYIKSGFINIPAEIICKQEKILYPILKEVLNRLIEKSSSTRKQVLGKQMELIEMDGNISEMGLKIKESL